jgi:two-component system sensor histidine kinase BarA
MPQHSPTLRRQLLKLLVPGLVFMMSCFSVLLVWMTTSHTSTMVFSNAQQVVRSLANQSVLALLTESAENAENALGQISSFPDVTGVGLLTASNEILVWHGSDENKRLFKHHQWPQTPEQSLNWQDKHYWYLAAAVVLEQNDNAAELSFDSDGRQHIGYALVSFSKERLSDYSNSIMLAMLAVTTAALLLLLLVINHSVKKITQPLNTLSKSMSEADLTQQHQQVRVAGTSEVQQIALSYNAMMTALNERDEQLRQHRNELEALVQIRTIELTSARDAALTSSRHKSEFLANMSHELRTPIQSIIGYIDLVKEQLELQNQFDLQDDLNRVLKNADRLLQMINSLLDLAKIEAGRMELHPRDCSLYELIQQSQDLINPLLAGQQNRLIVHQPAQDQRLRLDAEKLLQILVNLLSNAVKFTQQGEIQLSAEIDGLSCVFTVSDSGIGLTDQQMAQVFMPFYQADGSQSRKTGGTGLGLAITKQFVELMSGTIEVKHAKVGGAEFIVRLPVALPI